MQYPIPGPRSAERRLALRGAAGLAASAGLALAAPISPAAAGELYRDRTMPAPIAGIVPPRGTGGPLPLVDTRGQPFDFRRLAGGYGLLTFGFTQCGSTCPVSMAQAREIVEQLGPARAPTVLFVTLDPLSDTPEQLGTWLRRWDPRFVGLTGEPTRVERAVQAYRVGTRQGSAGLEHSSVWYLIDPTGETIRVYPLSAGVERIVADIRAILAARA